MFPLICSRKGELDAIDFVAIAIPSLSSLRLSHIKDSPLIMPLVAWWFLSVSPATGVLYSGATRLTASRSNTLFRSLRHSLSRRRCGSRSVFEQVSASIRTHRTSECLNKTASNKQVQINKKAFRIETLIWKISWHTAFVGS